jgi:hypothetical protein
MSATLLDQALVRGDLSSLSAAERVQYYNAVCQSLGLNPLTKPFAYLKLNGKEVLYALKDCTEQLRNIHAISLTIPARELIGEDVYVVTARASRPDGRIDESTGAVTVASLKGEAKANALMKAETKAKRRVTLSICGLGMLDETEVETIPNAHPSKEEARANQQAVAERKLKELEAPKADTDPVERMHQEKMAASGYGEPAVQPTWIDRPAAASKAPSAIPDAVLKMWERMNTIEARLAIFQQHKYELVQICGKEEGEKRYYEKLSPYKHANEVAKDAMKSRKIAKELWETIQNYKRPVNTEITEEDIPA